jgi:hypothetical protein
MSRDTTLTWLWPDHTIGKRESRELREEHNATVSALCNLIEATEYLIQDHPGTEKFEAWWPERVKDARAAIAKARGECDD